MTGRRRLVGWYIHHQGAGHTSRFEAVRRQLDADVVVFSSARRPAVLPPDTEWVELTRDDEVETADAAPLDPAEAEPDAGGLLHWAPLGHRGHARRLATVAQALAQRTFDAFVVDVSVEVTMLVRLLGVRAVVFAQPGRRGDRPHQLAYAAAERVVAPWPERLYRPDWLAAADDRVRFTGGISRFDGLPRTARRECDSVVLMMGAGGSSVTAADIDLAVASTPGTNWRMLGSARPEPAAGHPLWHDDPFEALSSAETVVAWAGLGSVADLAAVDAAAVVIAQGRPFGEQEATAQVLAAAGLAVTHPAWPARAEWPQLLDRARELQPDWSQWRVEGAARRAADAIAEVAAS
ncbi:hypothetical protein [Subtercola sp. YIM 133946]|uniref:hypothetical protein n=1 Tax=Subtercola sp. YIM 133946 TaxID=3118909 RepID=UPI002F9279F5